MRHKTAIIKQIRVVFRIPKEGFTSNPEALNWYKEHFRIAKGNDFTGSFGFRYDFFRRQLEFDYNLSPDGFFISYPYPLDMDVPFDREISSLAKELELPKWIAPVLRLVVLMGKLPEELIFYIPSQLIAPIGEFRLLLQPAENVSLRQWRKTGEILGILPTEVDMWHIPGVIQVYGVERKSKKQELYWQTYLAYQEVIGERRAKCRKGKRGILIETARILKDRYNWEGEPDSYTVRRYLDRAENIWYVSTREVKTKNKL